MKKGNPIHYYCLVDKHAPSSQRELTSFMKEMKKLHACKFTIEEIDGRDVRWEERNKKKYVTDSYVFTVADKVSKEYGKKVDSLSFFLDDKNFEQGDVRLRGFKLGRIFHGYYITVTKFRKGYEGTAEHEVLHFVDEFIKLNSGVVLEHLFGVRDFDSDIVHSQKYWKDLNYNYDEVWERISTLLSEAVFSRRVPGLWAQLRQIQVAIDQLMKKAGLIPYKSHSIPEIQFKKMHTSKSYKTGLKEENAIIAHIDLGTEKGTINEILNGAKSASYHWYIPLHAEYVVEFVPRDRAAWHAGQLHQPEKELVPLLGGPNGKIDSGEPNWYSYGICYEGQTANTKPTQAQIKLAVELVQYLKIDHLPWVEHWRVTSYKPKVVTEFVTAVQKLLTSKN
jgi:hypothetical protein